MIFRVLMSAVMIASAFSCLGDTPVRYVGLVLAGGGAKGAYEIGVWSTMCEAGLDKRVACISGTSVGSINAVLFASVADPTLCTQFWLEVVPNFAKPAEKHIPGIVSDMTDGEGIAVIKERLLSDKAELFGLDVAELSPADEEEALERAVQEWKRNVASRGAEKFAGYVNSFGSTNEVFKGFADVANFRRLLAERIPDKWAMDSVAVYATVLKKGAWEKEVFRIDHQKQESVLDTIIASSSIPILFDSQKISGKTYVDGGWESRGGDNIPLKPIIDYHPDIKTAIVVYLKDEKSIDANRRANNCAVATSAGVRLVEIIPSEDISGAFGIAGTFDTSHDTARRLIDLGRRDAEKILVANGLWPK